MAPLIARIPLAEQGARIPTCLSQCSETRSCMKVQSDRGMSNTSLVTPWKVPPGLILLNETSNCILARSPSSVTVWYQDEAPCSLMAASVTALVAQVKNGRVIDGEADAALERGHILELGVHRRPLRRADIHRVCRQRPFVEEVGAGTGDDGAVRPNRRHGPVSLGTRAAAQPPSATSDAAATTPKNSYRPFRQIIGAQPGRMFSKRDARLGAGIAPAGRPRFDQTGTTMSPLGNER